MNLHDITPERSDFSFLPEDHRRIIAGFVTGWKNHHPIIVARNGDVYYRNGNFDGRIQPFFNSFNAKSFFSSWAYKWKKPLESFDWSLVTLVNRVEYLEINEYIIKE